MSNPLRLQQLLKLLDLTRLDDQDQAADLQMWLQQTALPQAAPAAFCIYPQFLKQTALYLHQQNISADLATVVNFPSGQSDIAVVCAEITTALAQGADEIDCVLPYRSLMAGDCDGVKLFLQSVRQVSQGALLKIIIESGELSTAQQIVKATELCIETGADFVKSSTGKVAVGMTMEAARIMLTVIAAANRPVGFKASGGIRTVQQALALVDLYEEITGQLANPALMRIGASSLLTELLNMLAANKAN